MVPFMPKIFYFWYPKKVDGANLCEKNVCATGKIYLMSDVACVSFQPTLHIGQKLMRCEPPTHHVHIQSICNNLKRGLVLLTHQLLSSIIHLVSCIMDVIGRYFTPH